MDITQLLAFSTKNKASDLHLSAGLPPMIRCTATCGASTSTAGPQAGPRDDLRHHERRRSANTTRKFLEDRLLVRDRGAGALPVNAFNQNRGAGAVFRTIPPRILTLEQTSTARRSSRPVAAARPGAGDRPDRLRQVDHAGGDGQPPQRERVPTTSSRSRTRSVRARIQEVPDQPARGRPDTLASARRCARRCARTGHHPGRRDARPRTIRLALTAAETGHLVFGTLHTSSAAKTIDRDGRRVPAGKRRWCAPCCPIAAWR